VRSLLRATKEFFWPADVSIRRRRLELIFWAFILALAYLPIPFGFVAWFALARPIAIISKLKNRDAFKAAYFYFFMVNLFQLYWVAVVTPAGMVAAIFLLSLYPALVFTAFNTIHRYKKLLGIIALPVLWVGMEYFRSLTEIAFPWADLGYSQGYYLTLIQIASVIGVYGLSMIVMLLNIFIWQVLDSYNRLEKRVSYGLASGVLLVAAYLFGWVVMPVMPDPGNFKVALLQGNVPIEKKWSPETRDYNFILYDSLAVEASRDTIDLIIWPETAAPSYPRIESKYRNMLRQTAEKTGTFNLLGALDMEYDTDGERSYNAAFQFLPDGRLGQHYHKMNLVPFSERAPYQDYLFFLKREFLSKYLDLIKTRKVQWWSDFNAGDSIVIFNTDKADYATLICYEIAFPGFVRDCIRKGAQFLVTITNDTWFGRSSGPFQHMRLAVMRAVENRIWVARCANSGISAIIDPYGRERAYAGLYSRQVISGKLTPRTDFSVYTSIGPVVGKYCWLLTIIIFSILAVIWAIKKIR